MEVRFALNAQVISYNYTRYLCTQLDWGMRRDDDYLVIYASPESGNYVKKDTEQKPLGRLYVDEGYWSMAMYENFPYDEKSSWFPLQGSRGFEEYCDTGSLMRLIAKKVAPDYEIKPSPYIGSGSSQRFMSSQYAKAIIENADKLPGWTLLGHPDLE